MVLAATATTAASAGSAAADDKDEKQQCATAYEHAQELRLARRLREARTQLLVCSRPSCPKAAFDDCAAWLDEVQAAMPSAVVRVLDAGGAPIADATLMVDGAPWDGASRGASMTLDPGRHTVRVEAPGGAQTVRWEQQVFLRGPAQLVCRGEFFI